MKSKPTSQLPTAKYSSFTSLTLLPAEDTTTTNTSSHPTVAHSCVSTCTFENLNPSTAISHSYLKNSTIKSDKSDTTETDSSSSSSSSSITHSHVYGSTISSSHVSHSNVKDSSLSKAEHVSHTNIRDSTLSGTGAIEQCKIRGLECHCTLFDDGRAGGVSASVQKTTIRKSDVRNSTIGPSPCSIKRSKLEGVKISRSTIDDAHLKDCDVEGCRISRGKFSGLWLRNGVWEGGELVGKVRDGEEVTIKARKIAEIEQREKEKERVRGGFEGMMLDGSRIVGNESGGGAAAAGGVRGSRNDGLLFEIPGESCSGTTTDYHDDSTCSLTDHPRIPPRLSLEVPERVKTAHGKPPPSKEQPYISNNGEETPSTPSADGYSIATASPVDEDEDPTYHTVPGASGLLINEKSLQAPPPYSP
ncbi:hypothetical protein AJ79_05446 [Helicocarpus griseus UAMH5409]|uniref:Uncharacterized protein n=1 Tax=Helicocarpus griseus UAMH5409 TaxID=1447875 RepID=A0A2B7XPI7_9EURO|nr:hypothetical protein AJ79_05446 [Helicocarpus griseus UAMH5409]